MGMINAVVVSLDFDFDGMDDEAGAGNGVTSSTSGFGLTN